MKTSELTGALLDYWVAKAHGFFPEFAMHYDERYVIAETTDEEFKSNFAPSTVWAHGATIIEMEKIGVGYLSERSLWAAFKKGDLVGRITGETPLIAVCRYFVASKFGDEVSDGC